MKTKRVLVVASLALLVALATSVHVVFASSTNGTIPAASYAWGENFGWINFGCTNCNIQVTDSAVTGNAWSAVYGWINLSPTNGGVTNDGAGNLGGNAWSSGLGWISFSGVTINSSGQFTGVVGTRGSTAGRINFGCSNCNVTTDWRPASVRNGNSNNNGGNNSGNSNNGSVSSSGGFLPGFWNLFNNNPFGNAGVTVNNANSVNEENPAGANPVSANNNRGQNNAKGGVKERMIPAYPFATSTASASTTSKARVPVKPLLNVPSIGSNHFNLFSPLSLVIALIVLIIVIIIVILIIRFLL
jgi:hypothetical protein